MPPGHPLLMSLSVPYHKEQEYIWFRDGDLSGPKDFKLKMGGWALPLGRCRHLLSMLLCTVCISV